MRWKSHVRCGVGEKLEIISNTYLSLLIYSFRSSNIEILNQYKSECDEIIILNQNYRCASNILDIANNLISNNLIREKKNLFSLILPKYEIKYDDYRDTTQEAIFISNKINNLINKGYKPNEIAVLFRNNYESNEIEYQLQKIHIPFTTYGKKKFFNYDENKRIISLYYFLDDINDYIHFRKAIPIDQAYYEDLINGYKASNKSFLDYLTTYKNSEICNNLKVNFIPLTNSFCHMGTYLNYDSNRPLSAVDSLFMEYCEYFFNYIHDNHNYPPECTDFPLAGKRRDNIAEEAANADNGNKKIISYYAYWSKEDNPSRGGDL